MFNLLKVLLVHLPIFTKQLKLNFLVFCWIQLVCGKNVYKLYFMDSMNILILYIFSTEIKVASVMYGVMDAVVNF